MGPKFLVNAKFLEKSEEENNGVLRFAREVSLRLKAFDNRIQFIGPKKMEANIYSNTLRPICCGSSAGVVWEQVELPAFMAKNFKGFYLLNLNNISPLFYRNNISTVHDLTWKHFPQTFDLKSKVYLSTVMPLVIRNAKKILTVSNFSKKDLLQHYKRKEEDIKVIYPGFYHNRSSATVTDPAEKTLNQLGIIAQKYFLATMYKNPARMIEAFKLLNDSDVKLVFFGKLFKDVFGHLLREIEASENILYLGEVSDSMLSKLYSNAIAFVYPSLNEGFGMPPLEAMDHRCPVIASNVSSIPEVCGDAALYLDPYNTHDMSFKMKTLYFDSELRNKLISKGERRTSYFNYDKTVLELIEFLKSSGVYQ